MSELTEFCAARLDEDEAVARSLEGETWAADTYVGDEYNHGIVTGPNGERIASCGTTHFDDGTERATHIARWDPALVLREVAAMRALVDIAVDSCRSDNLDALAAIWCDHPDYRAEWKLDE